MNKSCLGIEVSAKNHVYTMIFRTAICFRVKQIAIIAEEKSSARNSPRSFATKLLRNRG